MEVLYDLRPRRRHVTARAIGLAAACFALAAAEACGGGGDRRDSTADSAVTGIGTATAPDTTQPDSAANADSAAADSVVAADTATILVVAVDSIIGDSLYHNSRGRCITCHGPRGAGNASLGPSLRDSVWVDTEPSVRGIVRIIRDGVAQPRGGTARMPAFRSQLDSVAIHQIAVYVYSLAHPGSVARDSVAAREAVASLSAAQAFDTATQMQTVPR